MEDENEYLKLPVEDRCVHKLWKARVSGYEEAIKLFNQYDGDDSNWKKVRNPVTRAASDYIQLQKKVVGAMVPTLQ